MMTTSYYMSKVEVLEKLDGVVSVWKREGNWMDFWTTNYDFIKRVMQEEVSDEQEELQARFLAEGYFGIKGTTRKTTETRETQSEGDPEVDTREKVMVTFRCRQCSRSWKTEMLRAGYAGEEISTVCEDCDIR